ncbi:MAG: DinB family protein [Ktedonobacterales bacterium]|nr:DinB family protein [Ktedonobacterales bacterium]
MSESANALPIFYHGWQTYQDQLSAALAPLSAEQLTLRAAPRLRSIGELATHIVAVRAGWFHDALGVVGDDFATLKQWEAEQPKPPVRTANELVRGLAATWAAMRQALARWTPADLAETVHAERRGQSYTFTRGWVVWHLIEHDLHHGGEVAYSLGMHGLDAPHI